MRQNHRHLIGTGDAAERLGVSTRTVHRWVKDGKLRALKSPGGQLRFDPDDIDGAFAEYVPGGAA
jgi:excisionase family DNA binding protein